MSGVRIVDGVAHLAEEVNAFAASIEPPLERWRYAGRVGRCKYLSKRDGQWHEMVNAKTVPALSRLTGISKPSVHLRVGQIIRMGFEGAIAFGREFDSRRVTDILPDYHSAAPLSHWCIGHVYLARVKSHPHVLKIGFSRRVRDRLEDISSKTRAKLVVPERHLKVGTQADEYWWHKHWAETQIEGEWFFDPSMPDRSLPDFLQKQEAA